jgi:parvulin-like peptidyl-prolyl isomerase
MGSSPGITIFKRTFCLLFGIGFFLSACGLWAPPEQRVVITVGKRPITPEEMKRAIRRISQEMDIPYPGGGRVMEILMGRVIDHYLILEYGREMGIAVSKEEVESAVEEIRKDYGQRAFQKTLLEKYIDFEEWKADLRRQILTKKIILSVTENTTPVPFREIQYYFDSHPEEFKHPPMVRFRQVLLRTRGEAEKVLERLKGGADMDELAPKYSIAPAMGRFGESGWIARGEIEKSLEDVIFSLSVGQMSSVVESPYGFHIFEVLADRPEGIKKLPEVLAEIESKLNYQRKEAFYQGWLKGLRKTVPVKINQRLLERMELG